MHGLGKILKGMGIFRRQITDSSPYVMEALSKLDHIAYIRFASVYKDFREVKDFEEFVETIDKLANSEAGAVKKED